VSTKIERADGAPMGIAGLWSTWKSPKGELVHSYTMLTINADGHSLMQKFHKPTDEKANGCRTPGGPVPRLAEC
jgi:putative SOS response-associated peptidase YedK